MNRMQCELIIKGYTALWSAYMQFEQNKTAIAMLEYMKEAKKEKDKAVRILEAINNG